MQKWILAVSPDTGFLEQVSAHLQEGGRFLVICAANGKEALTAAGSQPFDLAILDAEINDLPFVPLTRELTALIPNLRMLVYPPNNNPKHPALNGLIANGFLNKPFFGPEVISKITNIFKEIPPDQMADQKSEKTLPEIWVEDPNMGARQIEQLLGATSATAGLLLMRGQVIAATGALSAESNTNIVNFLTRYWTNIQSGELFRYLRMNFETVTYLVYAVPLFKNVAISLVYHTGVSLEDVRNEVANLRKGFLRRYTNTGELRHDFGVVDSALPITQNSFSTEQSPQRIKTRPIPFESQEILPEEENEESPILNENEMHKLDALIAEMPSPDPEEKTETAVLPVEPPPVAEFEPQPEQPTPPPLFFKAEEEEHFKESTESEPGKAEEFTPPPLPPIIGSEEPVFESTLPTPTEPEENTSEPERVASVTAPLPPLPQDRKSDESFPDFNFKLPWEEEPGNKADEGGTSFAEPSSIPLTEAQTEPVETAPQIPPEISKADELPAWIDGFISLDSQQEQEKVQPNELLFRYNFILVPRNSDQFITRPLSEILNQLLPEVHRSNNWEFISISTRPQYLLWSAAFPLSIPVCVVANEVRKAANEKLFTRFPQLLEDHPAADFWANGYFAISGASSPSSQLIRDFTELSRQASSRLNNF